MTAKQAQVRQVATVVLAIGNFFSIPNAIARGEGGPPPEVNPATDGLYSNARSGSQETAVPYVGDEPQWQTGSRPKRRQDLGQRGIPVCPSEIPMTALVPESGGGLTASARPEFFFYVPHDGATVFFSLFEMQRNGSKGEPISQHTQVVPVGRPLVRVTVPRDRQLLPGRLYTWQLTAVCNQNDRTDDIYVEGYIQRVQLRPEMTARLQEENQIEIGSKADRQTKLYAEHQLWFETLSALLDPAFCRTQSARARELLTGLLTSESVRLNPEIAAAAFETCHFGDQ